MIVMQDTRTQGVPAIHQATIDALSKALAANKLTDLDCLKLMQSWIEL